LHNEHQGHQMEKLEYTILLTAAEVIIYRCA